MSLQGRAAIVTGAGQGIGRAIAIALAEAGASVIAADIDASSGGATVERITERGGRAAFVHADVSRATDCEALVRETAARFGALHIAVNNAGISGAVALTGEYPIDDWNQTIAVNLSGVFYGMRDQLPAMRAAGGGSIVNIASIMGQVGLRGSAAYVAAKHGVVGLTRTAALEYAPHKVRVNAVGPGIIRTPLVENDLTPEARAKLERAHPMGRLGEPGEVAELVLWLASDRSSFVTGSYLAVDGGYLAQ
jgi:NAD(P)-dependent dehydrogenase (short-subunit alcohol dehydrogenase family)